MSNFEDLLGEYEPPASVDIVLPTKLGTNDKGGAASQGNVAGSSQGSRPSDQAQAATGPEPEPQLPEGSDPDEPDAVEDDAEDTEEASAPQGETTADEPGTDESEPAPDETAAPVAEGPAIPRKGGGLSFEGESAYLKQFPRVLIDQMREMLSQHLGASFARDISQVSIVTAFVMASIGAEFSTDEITGHAVKAFRAGDPRVDAIDQRTTAIQDQQAVIEKMLKRALAKLSGLEDTATVLEIGQAYSMSERTAQLDTMGVLPETIDVTQKRVLAARDNVRRKVEVEIRDERARAGRPIR